MPRLLGALCALLLLSSVVAPPSTVRSQPATHIVRCDGVEDAAAINAVIAMASPDDVVQLEAGPDGGCVLNAPVVVAKPLTLQGQPGVRTALLGPHTDAVASVRALAEGFDPGHPEHVPRLALALAAVVPSGPLVRVAAGPTTVRGLTLQGGWSPTMGGGLLVELGVRATVVDNEVRDSAASAGGGIALAGDNDESVIQGNIVTDNLAVAGPSGIDGAGGGLWIGPGTERALVVRNELRGNAAFGVGGGLALPCGVGDVLLEGNRLDGNRAVQWGGGLFLGGQLGGCGSPNLLVAGNQLRRNVAAAGGGIGVVGDHPRLRILNNAIAGNRAASAGGVGLEAVGGPADAAAFYYNSVAFNQAEVGGGLYQAAGGEPHVFNNVLWGNTSADVADDGAACLSPRHSIVGTTGSELGLGCAARGAGSVALDPLLASEAELDLHPRPGSPAGGLAMPPPEGVALPATDLDGVPRAGAPGDAGAYVLPSPSATMAGTPTATAVSVGPSATATPGEGPSTSAAASPTPTAETRRTAAPTIVPATSTARPSATREPPTPRPAESPRPPGSGRRSPTPGR